MTVTASGKAAVYVNDGITVMCLGLVLVTVFTFIVCRGYTRMLCGGSVGGQFMWGSMFLQVLWGGSAREDKVRNNYLVLGNLQFTMPICWNATLVGMEL